MNVENIKRVRDQIAGLPEERFNMLCYVGLADDSGRLLDYEPRGATNATALEGSCGTTACIAGWTLALLRPDERQSKAPILDAGNALGLKHEDAKALFEPHNFAASFRGPLHKASRAKVLRVLDHLLETGEVDWSVATDALQRARGEQAEGGR